MEPSVSVQRSGELTLDDLPDSVLEALREIGQVREEHVKNLSVGDRRVLAACERLRVRYIELEAQIDGGRKR